MANPINRRLWGFLESLYTNELTAESPTAETPPWITKPLLRHQKATLAAALALEAAKSVGIDVSGVAGDPLGGKFYTSHGILGDRVGSGKSLVALALLRQPPPPPHYVEYVARPAADGRGLGLLRTRSQLVTQTGTRLTPTTASLVIVPHALVDQWTKYIQEDTTLRLKVVRRKAEATNPEFLTDLNAYDVVLVSSTMWGTLRDFCQPTGPSFYGTPQPLMHRILWQRVFIDEADSIAFHNHTDEIHGLFYWFISASWLNLVFNGGAHVNVTSSYPPPPGTSASVIEKVNQSVVNHYFQVAGCRHRNIVRSMCGIHDAVPYISSSSAQVTRVVLRASEPFVSQSFLANEVTHTILRCETPASLRVLDRFLSPDMMERLHAGDVLGALDSLGMSSYSEDDLIQGITDSWKKELEVAQRTHEFKKTIEYSSDAAKAKAMETCEAKIASLQSRITAVEERIKGAKEHPCPVCYSESVNPAITPCCQQVFCFGCLYQSLSRTHSCPLCRAHVDLKSIKVLGTNTVSTEGTAGPVAPAAVPVKRGKRETALSWIVEHPEARILVFSSYDATFAGFDGTLTAAGLSNATLMGSQARISKLLREFKEGIHRVLFLNARNVGAGLNIDCATHVLMFHKMPPELEKQIIGRAVRLGRTAPLEVVHLLHDNESRSTLTHV